MDFNTGQRGNSTVVFRLSWISLSVSYPGLTGEPMSSFFDRCGMTVSGLCGVHCTALVLVSIFQPAVSWLAGIQSWLRPLEMGLALIAGVLAVVAFLSGYRHHGHLRPVLLGATGLSFIFVSVFTPLHDFAWASILTALGGVALIVGHRWNIKCRCASTLNATKAP